MTSTATYSPYSYSKLVAEREAWKICGAQDRWDLVSINPGLVLGPLVSHCTWSCLFLKYFMLEMDGIGIGALAT